MARKNATAERSAKYQMVWYACAVVFPLLSAWITVRTPELHSIPFALNFSVIAGLGALAGPGPALVSILTSVAAYSLPFNPLRQQFNFSIGQIERTATLLAGAFFLTFLSWKQRSAENKLRATLESLQERTEALTLAQQGSDLGTWLFNADTMETFWDPGSTRVFGRPFVDLDNKALPLDFILPEDRERFRESIETAVNTGQPLRAEYRVLWPNGDIHWLEARGSKVPGSHHLWRGATFDVTRRKVVETALIRSEKLAAMGRLASTVAHEVNNPLESVTNLLYLIDSDETLSDATRSYVTLAEEEIARLANITRLTLTFARSASVRAPVKVAEVLDAVLSIYQRRCDLLNIAVERFYTPGVEIEIAPHELRQVLINLIANAIDAFRGDKPLLRLHTGYRENRAVVLVEDNGTGIETADQTRIFDAFFSTKADVGTGIGLWVTKELVEKNGGSISVESGNLDQNISTRFRLEFPVAASLFQQTEAPPPSEVSPAAP
ncbi:MAG: PAS domain-containing protein [Acidobacteria bacterium]|nr:PAS domain-containing protein [Acidobacteriota bacterium]